MPVINLDITPLTLEQKKALAAEFTAAASRITGVPETAFYVYINEHAPTNVGVGGKLLGE